MSDTVTLEFKGAVALIVMRELQHGNMFTDALVGGLNTCLAQALAAEQTRAVVLAGDGPYFSCGGTKEDLLAILEGKISFIQKGVHELLINFPLPVVTALQGHALGGGLAFGCSGDFVIFGRENVYAASFMKYGFTPGMGSTLYLPRVFGDMLANELLYTSHSFRGQDFVERHAPVTVVPKSQVVEAAVAKAQLLADKEREALILLKQHLTFELWQRLPRAIEGELAMHERTFLKKDHIRARILKRFGDA